MTEPKYKVGDWILLTDNNIIEYTKTMDSLHYGYYQTEPYIGKEDWFDDGNVIGIIKIIPIPETKPYCKDCKNFSEIGEEGYFAAYWCSCECPIFAWAQQAVEPCGSRLSTSQTQIGNDNYNVELLQPPDNCYCFEPKEETK